MSQNSDSRTVRCYSRLGRLLHVIRPRNARSKVRNGEAAWSTCGTAIFYLALTDAEQSELDTQLAEQRTGPILDAKTWHNEQPAKQDFRFFHARQTLA